MTQRVVRSLVHCGKLICVTLFVGHFGHDRAKPNGGEEGAHHPCPEEQLRG